MRFLNFDNEDKFFRRSVMFVSAVWFVNIIVTFGLIGGAVWVAWHFISKYW